GSMGPLYGTFFKRFFRESKNEEKITAPVFLRMLESALNAVMELGNAKVGDKTLIDTLSPAVETFKSSIENNENFEYALTHALEAARKGRDSTKDMIAKVGRSARLGERSRGVLDAGSVSCYIILETMCNTVIDLLDQGK
ncbi:MAG TPA: dihydroxyacetone kinase subunit L, partial [Draconibacterium sp.]|nr:dihydroxyacetone kinase subunit L [Draconibacterium sp.]